MRAIYVFCSMNCKPNTIDNDLIVDERRQARAFILPANSLDVVSKQFRALLWGPGLLADRRFAGDLWDF